VKPLARELAVLLFICRRRWWRLHLHNVTDWLAMIRRSSPPGEFYHGYFASSEPKSLIQIGANDGVMCDPLRPYLACSKESNVRALLIEPVPFYCDKLRALYEGYPNISVMQVACGAAPGRMPLFFVEPATADQMNGGGPANDWAHGQGSFDRKIVQYWIERNRFRGKDYVRNIDTYHSSIVSTDVDVVRLADIEMSKDYENLLVVIDVQGFEVSVVRGIDWDCPPAFIVFEDDMGKAGQVEPYLTERGYSHLCGRNDKVYIRTPLAMSRRGQMRLRGDK
jgi:FkbM family methyltransferase